MNNNYKIYTDGSHIKTTGRLGIGSVLVDSNDKIIDTISMNVDRYTIKELYNTSDVSNPTMEMYSVLMSLRIFNKYFKFYDNIDIMTDYIGVIGWMTGEWKINKDYILMIKSDILTEINSQKLNVTYNKVKGHSGDYFNDIADKLAKGEYYKYG